MAGRRVSGARPLALSAAVLLLVPGPGTAQEVIAELPDSGFVRGGPTVPREAVDSACVLPLAEPTEVGDVEVGCDVLGVAELGEVGGTRWVAVSYRRPVIDGRESPPDSTSFDQVVLLSGGPGEGPLTPRWTIETDRMFEFLSGVDAVRRGEGLVVELLICLNGTGGCTREYLLTFGERIQVVEKRFAAELAARLPAGLRLHKGMTLDLGTLRGIWPVAAEDDPNCCPSRELAYEVRFAGAAMVLVRSELRPAGYLPAPGPTPVRGGRVGSGPGGVAGVTGALRRADAWPARRGRPGPGHPVPRDPRQGTRWPAPPPSG